MAGDAENRDLVADRMTHYLRIVAVVAVLTALVLCVPVQAQTPEIDALRARAEQGDARAQSRLGNMYRYGEGVPQDDAEAVRWYRLAAEQGYASAQTRLGVMHFEGRGVMQDFAEAARWYRRAADQGEVHAQFFLGGLYTTGRGVPQDDGETLKGADQQRAAVSPFCPTPCAVNRRSVR